MTDLGFAREGVTEQTVITVPNSIYYAPPEFADLTTWGMKSDQFSLAATYLHLRTGAVSRDKPFGQPKLDPMEPPEREVLEKALAQDPDARFPTCEAFADALWSAQTAGGGIGDGKLSLPDVAQRLSSVEQSLAALTLSPGGWKNPAENPDHRKEAWRWGWAKAKPWLPVGVAGLLAILIGLMFASAVPKSLPPTPPTGFVREEEVAALRKQVEALRDGADYPKLFARALTAYETGDADTARTLLDVCPLEERQFEYHLLQAALIRVAAQ